MSNFIRAFFLSLTIAAIMLFSAFGTTTVYADDETPTPTPETSTTPETDPGAPADTGTEEVVPVVEVLPPVDEVVTEIVADAPAEPILEQVPENITVTVLNPEGEAQPLASQASADAIASTTDPIWCPATQTTPTPGANGCTESFTSFDDLLSFLLANEGDAAYQQAGTIYIEQGAYAGGETSIDFNNYGFTNFNTQDLTLQGGWDPTDSSVDSTSQFTAPIIIGSSLNPWVGSLTINNLSISDVTGQAGLTLFTSENINLDEVEITDSQAGANLNAGGNVIVENSKFNNNQQGGADINAGGLVDVANSEFNENGSAANDGYGLKIVSTGKTSLSEVSASRNKMFGADVTAGGPVQIATSIFSGNAYYYEWTTTFGAGYGLKVVSSDDILVEDIVAQQNYFFGASLDGANIKIDKGIFNDNGNSPNADYPVGYGLEVISDGTVTLTAIEANLNRLFGANIDAVGNVNITNGFFNSNQGVTHSYQWKYDGYGLQVITDGNIKLDAVTANDNYLFGAHLEGAIVGVSNSSFSENRSDGSDGTENTFGYGLEVKSTNNVNLIKVTANNNQRFGANIQTTGAVTVTDSFFNGNKSYTYSSLGEKNYDGYGIQVVTGIEVSLVNVAANGNNLFGAHIEAGDVAIDTAVFSNNGSGTGLYLTGRGLEVISENDVALFAVTANDNQLFGADILAGNLVAIAQSDFNDNDGYGLQVVTTGLISLGGKQPEDRVNANNNNLYGAYLKGGNTVVSNSFFTANGSLGVVSEPIGYGLKIVSTGSVNLSGIDASNNQLFGADIGAEDKVTILNSFFSGHQSVTFTPCLGLTFYGYGLNVVTQDDIFLNFVTANFNNLWGGSLTGNDVTVYNSQFNNNVSDSSIFIDDTGLLVNASGYVDIYKVEAKENRLIGATIKAAGDVFIDESNFNDNRGFTCSLDWCPEESIIYHGYGLQVTTPGLIQVTGTNANNNNLFGASLNGALVTVSNSIFNNNGMGNGLTINTSDNVTLTNVTAVNNGGNGVDVTGVCAKLVQANGGTFTDNDLYGISVINATLTLDGTQIFANNTFGNIFTDTSACPVVIVPVASSNNTPDTGTDNTSNTPDTGADTTNNTSNTDTTSNNIPDAVTDINTNTSNTSASTSNNSNSTTTSTSNSSDTNTENKSNKAKLKKSGVKVKFGKNGIKTKFNKNSKPGSLIIMIKGQN